MGFMPASAVVIPLYRQDSVASSESDSDVALSLSDMVYDFLEDCDSSPESGPGNNYNDVGEDEGSFDVEESKVFWETQEKLLQGALCRTSSIESNIRQATKEALRDMYSGGAQCTCGKVVAGRCRDCQRREVSVRLRNAGYDCGICKSKWRSSPEIPSGEHTYLEVVDKSKVKKGEVRVIIELNLRAEFEMARANDAYSRLTGRLPEVFVGKGERIKVIIKIMCGAAKKCMKEKKMHLGPWRKHKYMQAKWLGTPPPPVLPDRAPARPKASLLTFDLLHNLTTLHFPSTIQVL